MCNLCALSSASMAMGTPEHHVRRHADIPCACNEIVGELARGVRAHFPHYVKQLEGSTWHDAQRGLAHSYSRARVKFNVNRVDNMIIQVRSFCTLLSRVLPSVAFV